MTSIRIRLLAIMLPFLILSFGILSGISYYLSQQFLSQSVDETAMATGKDHANRIQASILREMTKLEDLASVPAIRSGADNGQIVGALAEAHKRIGVFDTINLIFLDGKAIRPDGTIFSLGDREYFKKVATTKKPYVSDPVLTRLTGKMSVVLTVPVFDNGQLSGVLIGTYSLDRMSELVKEVKFKETGHGFVCASSGVIIAEPLMPETINKLDLTKKQIASDLKLKEAELDGNLLNLFHIGKEKQVLGKYIFNGVERLGVFTPISLPGDQQWVMIISAPEKEATQATLTLSRTMIAVSSAFVLFAVIFVVVLSKRFTKPIQLIRDECMLLTQGDLRERAARVLAKDEIGQLAQGFRTMRANLRALVMQVQSQSEQVAAASEELTASAQQAADAANQVAGSITEIARGTESQAASATHISAVAEQMSASTQQTLATVRAVAEIAVGTSQEAEQGRQSVEQAVDQMSLIGDGSEAVQAAIAELAKGSREISEIVNLISTIAGQTNLLALNAAIEAARAGEHGRGFAVVAEEVRKLAEESNQAALQIGALIQKNQANMDQAVAVTQAGTEGVKAGIEVVNSAGKTFKSIVGSITQLSDQMKEISRSIDRMAADSRTLVSSIWEIDQVSKENAAETQTVSAATEQQSAAMQEIASSSQNLAKLAGDLQESVTKFRV